MAIDNPTKPRLTQTELYQIKLAKFKVNAEMGNKRIAGKVEVSSPKRRKPGRKRGVSCSLTAIHGKRSSGFRGEYWVYVTDKEGKESRKHFSTTFHGINRRKAKEELVAIAIKDQRWYDGISGLVARAGRPRRVSGPRTSSGAHSELLVCADLIGKGIGAFRNADHTGSVDIIALVGGKAAFRVEVKTGDIFKNGKPACNYRGNLGRFDVLAVALPDGSVSYFGQDGESLFEWLK